MNRSRDINRDINRNVDWNRDIDVDVDYGRVGCCYNRHPVARAAVAGAAYGAAASSYYPSGYAPYVGETVYYIPDDDDCDTEVVNGYTVEKCDSGTYQPQFSGSDATYVVVSP